LSELGLFLITVVFKLSNEKLILIDVQENNFKEANSEEIDVQDKSWTPEDLDVQDKSWTPEELDVQDKSWTPEDLDVQDKSWTPEDLDVQDKSWTPEELDVQDKSWTPDVKYPILAMILFYNVWDSPLPLQALHSPHST
jgi:hypothetical protein